MFVVDVSELILYSSVEVAMLFGVKTLLCKSNKSFGIN
jgi:hypothetical protein